MPGRVYLFSYSEMPQIFPVQNRKSNPTALLFSTFSRGGLISCLEHQIQHIIDPLDEVVDWLELPYDVLSLIANKLHLHMDFIRFGAVCQSWKSVYTDLRRKKSHSHSLPLLLLATESNCDDAQTRSLYNLTNKQVSNYQVQLPHNKSCRGSSHGWLITVCENMKISLVNPFSPSSNEIHLPPLSELICDKHPGHANHPGYLNKAVLSANPTLNPNYAIMAIYCACSRLAFFRPGDDTWSCVDLKRSAYADVIYYRDQFYFVSEQGDVYSFNLDIPHPLPPTKLSVSPPLSRRSNSRYLVDSSGDLLQVVRYTVFESSDDEETENEGDMNHPTYFNNGFDVFKLDTVERKWVLLRNLDGHLLFLGDNCSLCLKASDFLECKVGSIYFTDDYYEGYFKGGKYGIGPHDLGVYSLEHGTLEPHYPTESKMIYPAPIWIEPQL